MKTCDIIRIIGCIFKKNKTCLEIATKIFYNAKANYLQNKKENEKENA